MYTKKIYLASGSSARRQLLRDAGFKFSVVKSGALEKAHGKHGIIYLVKYNALIKALAVSKKIKSGVVIAADTMVKQDSKVFGKARHIGLAVAMLKQLSRKPHWVYTGVAVVDAASNKKIVDFEKTKVYMEPLSEREIRAYLKKTGDFNKAGSFNIQKHGGLFIRRIEGCFYNVVGLPMAKLYQMLEKVDVRIFGLMLLSFLIAGCATEYNIATEQQEMILYSSEKEVKLGQSIAKQVEEKYKPVDDPLMQKRIQDIGKQITAVCDRKDIDYAFKVISPEENEKDEVNAFALPGGFIYTTKALMEKATDDELAGVLGHEIGHVVAKHSIKKLQAAMGYMILRILVSQTDAAAIGQGADMAFNEILLGYGRQDELLADRLAVRYLKRAGYKPGAMISFLDKLRKIHKKKIRPFSYERTHPFISDRIATVKQELGMPLEFDDYINRATNPQ